MDRRYRSYAGPRTSFVLSNGFANITQFVAQPYVSFFTITMETSTNH